MRTGQGAIASRIFHGEGHVTPPMTVNHTTTTPGTERRYRWATRASLLAILLLGAYLRFLSLTTWDEPSSRLHPDERFFTDLASMLQVP